MEKRTDYFETKNREFYYEFKQTEDKKKREEWVLFNKHLVYSIAKKFTNFSIYDDIIQEGYIGLIHAVDRYNPNLGNFSSFAYSAIMREIIRYIRKNRSIVHPPINNQLSVSKDVAIDDIIDLEAETNPETVLQKKELVEDVQKTLKLTSLSDILIRIMYDENTSIIARAYKVSRREMHQLETRAVKTFKKRFETPEAYI
ncbi:sigma-70 family RNA polymerase sigma factor [Candidatus Woesearchaeota archaeon]|nr:sigma-70 family RNA polymerase sigma factor [Candidatus Woesearchaeota archaeon]